VASDRVASDTVEPRPAAVAEPAQTNGAQVNGAQANGLIRNGATAFTAASTNGTPSPRLDVSPVTAAIANQVNGKQVNGNQVNGNGVQSTGHSVPNDPPADLDSQRSDSEPAQPTGNRVAPVLPPPAPPGPPASPAGDNQVGAVPSAGSGAMLFRPARATVTGLAGPGYRVTLQHSTPIFDDVASAWFKDHEAVPVRWIAPSTRGSAGTARELPTRDAPSPDAPLPDAPLPDALSPDALSPDASSPNALSPDALSSGAPLQGVAAHRSASATVVQSAGAAGSSPLIRRQPGKALAQTETGDVGKLRSAAQPVASQPVASQPVTAQPVASQPAEAPDNPRPAGAQDWGAADEGWRAAEALAMPMNAELTPMGLPRRQPRALLVPGAAGAAQPTSAPVRSAESIRGRLASYQQGIREGRQAREVINREADGSSPGQQDGAEEAQ
jgi:hypothetical protein